MTETKSDTTRHKRSFPEEICIVLLLAFVTMQVISNVIWPAVTFVGLSMQVNWLLSAGVISFSILGIYGLLKASKIGPHFALSGAVFEVMSGAFSLISLPDLKAQPVSATQYVVPVILGILGLVSVSKMMPHQQRSLKSTPIIETLDQGMSGSEYSVELFNVNKTYELGPSSVAAIRGLSMKVYKGEILAIMGPSGSGKSTLLNLIGALDRPSSGRILIDGVDISTLNDSGLAKLRNEKIGFVFQSYNLINRSKVLRNMELPTLVKGTPKAERQERITGLLEKVGLENKADRRPKTLSGGEQQRVAIARALVNDPKILLADEPTGNLDSKTGREIMDYLKKTSIEKGTTAIIVTHNEETAEVADRIIHFRDGKIVEEELLRGQKHE